MILWSDLCGKFQYAIDDHWGYIYGRSGQTWTQKMQDAATRPQTISYGQQWVGHRVADCSGMFVWAFKELGSRIYHGSNTIWREYCSAKGKLENGARTDGKPMKAGTAVFLVKDGNRHHIGLYVGNGTVIEAKGTKWGVVISKTNHWDEWGELKDVDYTGATEENIVQTLKKGSRGDAVRALQEMLNKIGYDCGTADGIFGTKTEKAVKRFQEAEGLEADGIAGEKTQEILAARAADPDVPELPEDDDEIDEPQHIMVDCVELMTARDYMAKALNKIDKMLKEGGMQP